MHVDTAYMTTAAPEASDGPSLRALLTQLWQVGRPLVAVGLLMLATLVATIVGLAVDDRVIAGAPAWLKPAKFAISSAIYVFTLAWVFSHLPDAPRTRRIVGWTTAVVFVLEVAIVALQAWRGTTSHFNIATPMNAILFGVMGAAIAVQTIASAWVAIALWRQRFDDKALGAALRAGMVLTIVGASSAGLMTRPTADQLASARATGQIAAAGAHTVGGPDGGPGLPGVGWSRQHGDLRIPHFVGLHALQVLAVVALVVRRYRNRSAAHALVRVAAASYAALFALLLVQALRGEAVVAPGASTVGLLLAWAVGTAASARLFGARRTLGASGSAFMAG